MVKSFLSYFAAWAAVILLNLFISSEFLILLNQIIPVDVLIEFIVFLVVPAQSQSLACKPFEIGSLAEFVTDPSRCPCSMPCTENEVAESIQFYYIKRWFF